jgi:hypothetical protein
VKNVTLHQKAKVYLENGSFVYAKELFSPIEEPVPENIYVFDIEAEWTFPTATTRAKMLKQVEIFDPIKIEIGYDLLAYKNVFIETFLKSWRIRGPDTDISNKDTSLEDLPCDFVDIMYDKIYNLTRKAEDELGKV